MNIGPPAARVQLKPAHSHGRRESGSWHQDRRNGVQSIRVELLMMGSRGAALTVGIALLAVPVLSAGQNGSQNGSDPAFEVVSVKPNVSVNQTATIRLPPGGVNAINVPPYMLIRYAFGLPDSRIVDVPDWAKRIRFDVLAKAPANAVDADMRPMVRTLLRDRFKLVTRQESRPMRVQVLTRDVDRPLGARLTLSRGTCAQNTAGNRSGALSSDEKCGLSIAFGRVRGGEVSLAELASGLGTLTGSVVVDRTGLSGLYNFNLEYTPDAATFDPATAKELNIDPDGPSLATALREQLGLRWTNETAPVDVLVVVRIQQPDPD